MPLFERPPLETLAPARERWTPLYLEHGVTWKGRNYDRHNWDTADDINRALSAANASLYALCAAVIRSLGYVPSLGFVHDAGTLPFVHDVADLYKHLTSIPAAFLAVRQNPKDEGELVRAGRRLRGLPGPVLRRGADVGCERPVGRFTRNPAVHQGDDLEFFRGGRISGSATGG
jgi:hypothetical protein